MKYSYIAKVETLAEDWKKIRTKVFALTTNANETSLHSGFCKNETEYIGNFGQLPSLPDLGQLNEGASREGEKAGPWHHLLAQLTQSQV